MPVPVMWEQLFTSAASTGGRGSRSGFSPESSTRHKFPTVLSTVKLLAAFSAIRHFRFQLKGREFQLCQLSYIAEYTAEIRNVPGVENVVADTLSRPAAIISSAGAVQQPQAASLCTQPLAAIISSAGPARQPQAASLCTQPPAAVISSTGSSSLQPSVTSTSQPGLLSTV